MKKEKKLKRKEETKTKTNPRRCLDVCYGTWCAHITYDLGIPPWLLPGLKAVR